jgi:hypothetical protein
LRSQIGRQKRAKTHRHSIFQVGNQGQMWYN